MSYVLFFYFSIIIVGAALLVVSLRKPVYSALSLLVMFFHVAGLFVTLNAEFVAVVQILVYAGAVLVLYLFVVMLMNVSAEEGYHKQFLVGLVFAGVFVLEAAVIVFRGGLSGSAGSASGTAIDPGVGNTEAIGQVLYTTYLFPFEVASLILLVAMIGAIVLSKKGIFSE
ncbi:MAG TPA: NADH-quinone oxidoreductase subunit J [Nitrospiria bacterium]|nr:NADH-quinone oxidoreductase subunit J [Nitrospiria bacterium]